MKSKKNQITVLIMMITLALSSSSYVFHWTNRKYALAGIPQTLPTYFASDRYLQNPRTCAPIIALVAELVTEEVIAYEATEALALIAEDAAENEGMTSESFIATSQAMISMPIVATATASTNSDDTSDSTSTAESDLSQAEDSMPE